MPKWTKTPSHPVKIAFLVFDHFSNLCLANCIEPLRAANTLGVAWAFDWKIMTPDGRLVRSSSGIYILPDAALPDLSGVEYLFVIASYHHYRHDTAANRRLLQRAVRKARVTVGLDAGPWLLASAGLLNGRQATVHWDLLEVFAEDFPEVETIRARVLRDGPMMTCAGAMSAMDLTLELIACHLGLAARLDVEALFLRGEPPVGTKRTGAITDSLVRRAVALMRDRIETPLPIPALARHLSCQPRTLDRYFRARLGAPPGTVYRHLRLSAARKLIENSRMSVAEIALRCGYESPAALTRSIRRAYGASPRELRTRRTLLETRSA